MKNLIILTILNFSFTINGLFGQDINFSQFYDLPILRNPSIAGIFTGDLRITAAYRNQWQSVTTPYRTFGLGIELKKPIPNTDDYFDIGLQLTNDIAGDSRLSRAQILPAVNFQKSISNLKNAYLSVGFLGGPVLESFDPTALKFDDQFINGSYSPANPTRQTFTNHHKTFWDASAGISLSSTTSDNIRYYIAFGLFHFNKPKVAFQRQFDIILNEKYVMNCGITAPLNEINTIIFYADFFKQGGSKQFQGGILLNHDLLQTEEEYKRSISAGLLYRFKDAIVPVLKFEYAQYSIGFSYDINLSKLKTASQYRGGLECTLSYMNFNKNKNSSLNKVKCPIF
jgi:type IX secretion system PorP/SprF family membrane protein